MRLYSCDYYFDYYRSGGIDADQWEGVVSESEDEVNTRKVDVEYDAGDDEQDYDDRDYSIYYHLRCFAQCKTRQRGIAHLPDPSFEGCITAQDKTKASQVWAELQAGALVNDSSLESRGHLTEEQFIEIQSLTMALEKWKVAQLRSALKNNSQGLLHDRPKLVLVETIAELKVLGALPKCPNCKGGRNGKSGNLHWNRETNGYTCTGFFSMAGPQACKGPGRPDSIVRRAWED